MIQINQNFDNIHQNWSFKNLKTFGRVTYFYNVVEHRLSVSFDHDVIIHLFLKLNLKKTAVKIIISIQSFLKDLKSATLEKITLIKPWKKLYKSEIDKSKAKFEDLRKSLRTIARNHLVKKRPQKKALKIQSQVVDVMKQKRTSETKEDEYRVINKKIQKKIHKTEEEYQCEEMKLIEIKKFHYFCMHKMIKEMPGCQINGTIIFDEKETIRRWREWFQILRTTWNKKSSLRG